jgi:hypothetical protein
MTQLLPVRRAPVAKTNRGYNITAEIISEAIEMGPMKGFSDSTYSRRDRVMTLWDQFLERRRSNDPLVFFRCLEIIYKPSTTLCYIQTWRNRLPHLVDERVQDATEYFKKAKARATPMEVQATPATPMDVRKILSSKINLPTFITILVMWITMSRYADVTEMVINEKDMWQDSPGWLIVCLLIPCFKSDLHGKRHVHKFMKIPMHLLPALSMTLRSPPTYAQMYQVVKPFGLTLHSFRRGSVTQTIKAGYPAEHVIQLTAHSTLMDPKEIRRYADPSPTSSLGKVQLGLSNELWKPCYDLPLIRNQTTL